jgi:glycosyltransferase involved in cell wall biosynthesis
VTASASGEAGGRRKVRVLRVITRMNMGGPAYHVSLLSGRLDPGRYETLLVTGAVGPGEASLEDLAERYGARLRVLADLGPTVSPPRDLRALAALVRIVRAFRPDIVHTHTAKAGTVGRLAALLAPGRRPLVVHTYHGHVLEGYFGPRQTAVYRGVERLLARATDCLVGVSEATVRDLVRLRVAPPERIRAIPLGLDLERFAVADDAGRARFRAEVGAGPDDVLLAYLGRLVPIKRVDLLLQAVARARAGGSPVRLAIVGDGTLRPELEALARRLGVAEAVRFLGYRTDLEAIMAATDVGVLASANEGTPVSLIEAAAAGRPAVATAVGGVPEVVREGAGLLVPAGDAEELAAAIATLASDAPLREAMGARAREHVLGRFASERLLEDVDRLYRELLAARPPIAAASRSAST